MEAGDAALMMFLVEGCGKEYHRREIGTVSWLEAIVFVAIFGGGSRSLSFKVSPFLHGNLAPRPTVTQQVDDLGAIHACLQFRKT